jgi:DNA-binding NtrC family response regulator
MMARHGMNEMRDQISNTEGEVGPSTGLRDAVAAFERQMISNALRAHEGRMDDVAHDLRIGRRTLNEKIVKLGLDKEALL